MPLRQPSSARARHAERGLIGSSNWPVNPRWQAAADQLPHADDPEEVLHLLRVLGARVSLDGSGQLRVEGLPVELRAVLDRRVTMLVAAVLNGRRSGHVWARCSTCGMGMLVKPGRERGCAMTPRCPGTLSPRRQR